MASVSMIFDVIARDNASGSFRRISAEAGGAAASFDKVGKAAAGMTLLLGAFAVNAAVKFESSMARINTQAGVPLKQIKGLSEALLNLAPKVGVGPEALATSLYHVESAFRTTGISAGKALDIVKAASQLSQIGHADLESTTQAIIGTLASGIKGVKDAADAAAQINQLVGTGDTTLAAVTKAVATGILPTAQTLGLSFKDVAAALATLTDNATPADEAATRLRTTLSLVENPGGKAKAALNSIRLSSVDLANDFRKPNGLLVALEDLKTHLDAQYPLTQKTALSTEQIAAASKGYRDQLVQQGASTKEATKLSDDYANSLKKGGTTAVLQAQTILTAFGGARSGSTFLTLFNELDRLQSKYKDFGTSAQAAAKFQSAWAVQQDTAKQKLDQLKASWDVFLVRLGNAILPDLKKVVDVLAKHPGIIKAAAVGVAALGAAWTGMKIAKLIGSLGELATRILAVGAASTTASAETAAANLGGGIAGAESVAAGAAARASLGRRAAAGAVRLVIPVAVTYAATSALGLNQSISDIVHGQFTKAANDAPGWSKDLSLKLSNLLGRGLAVVGTSFKNAGGAAQSFWNDFAPNAAAVTAFQVALKNANSLLDSGSNALDDNTASAMSNRAGLSLLANQAIISAHGYANVTGAQTDFTAALQLAVPQILDAAQATGISRQAAADYLNTVIKIPGFKVTTVGLDGTEDAQRKIAAYLQSLAAIPAVVRTETINYLETVNSGAVSGTTKGTLGALFGAGAAGQADGGIYRSKIPGGVFQWAEAGGESFIPHDPAKRPRALSILKETARILGVTSMADGGIVATSKTAVADFLKSLANVAKFGVNEAEKTVTTNFAAASKAIADAVKEGNGPLQRSLEARLKAAEGALYGTAVGAVRDGQISPLENLAIAARSKAVTAITAALVKLNTVNENTITRLQNFVQAQTQFRDSLKSTLQTGATFADILTHSGTPGDIKTLLAGKLADVKQFATKISALKKQGWPDAIIRDVASAGVGLGVQYADVLLGASKTDRSTISSLAGQLSGAQSATSNYITAATGGTAGLSNSNAFALLNKAIYSPGANTDFFVKQAEAAQRTQGRNAPVIGQVNVSTAVDYELIAKQAAFLESAGHF